MKKIIQITVVVLFLFSFQGMGQQTQPLKTDYNISVGTSLFSLGGMGHGMMNYVFPQASFSTNKKWHINTGVVLTNFSSDMSAYQFSNLHTTPLKQNVSTAYVVVDGDYQFNKKLLIQGSVYKSMNSDGAVNPQDYNQRFNTDAYGMDFGLRYKFSENSILDFQVRYQNGYSPFYRNSYNNRFGFYDRGRDSVFDF